LQDHRVKIVVPLNPLIKADDIAFKSPVSISGIQYLITLILALAQIIAQYCPCQAVEINLPKIGYHHHILLREAVLSNRGCFFNWVYVCLVASLGLCYGSPCLVLVLNLSLFGQGLASVLSIHSACEDFCWFYPSIFICFSTMIQVRLAMLIVNFWFSVCPAIIKQ
jgi:hypothetical protein